MTKQAVLITGGARRVGAVLSRHFAAHGYDIALHYRHSQGEAVQIKKEIEAGGGVCELFAHDLQDTRGLAAMVGQVHKTMPYCAALINNASVFERASFLETDEVLFDRQLDTNFKAPFFLTQAFARTFGKGCVVNILDTDITQTQGSHFAYLLSKKALAEFTQMAARELGPKIRVNGICPGIMLPSNDLDEIFMNKLRQTLPLQKLTLVEEIAAAAHYLCLQGGMTGQLLFVDSGQHLL